MSKFQIIVIALFILFIIIGVAAFATYKGGASSTQLPAITVWGTFPKDVFDQYVSKINNTLAQGITVTYVTLKPDQFGNQFIAALARGTGPDAILIPADMILPHEDKLALIPYSALSLGGFKAKYIQEGEIYLSQNGILALPFTIDPLIMYWNRDMFNAAGIAQSPQYWDEFATIGKKITVTDQNGNVRKSALAMGEFDNIENARELFGTLLLQSGNPVVAVSTDGIPQSAVKTTAAASPIPAVQFFTQFVDPSSAQYSWNRSMPDSKSAFLSGILATYFGFASEIRDIRSKNPNLNFDAALIPQLRAGGVKTTYGRMYGLSIVRTAPNLNAVYQVISTLTSPSYISDLSNTLYLPTVRRDVIAAGNSDPYLSIFNNAALVARTWLDVDTQESGQIWSAMVEAITSGQKNANNAIQDAGDQFDVVLRQAVGH